MFFLANITAKNNSGLYRDGGLMLLRNVNKLNMDQIRKNVIKIFKKARFKIEIKANLKIVENYKCYIEPNKWQTSTI